MHIVQHPLCEHIFCNIENGHKDSVLVVTGTKIIVEPHIKQYVDRLSEL